MLSVILPHTKARLLVDTGAGINIIKEGKVPPNVIKKGEKTTFYMGNDRHESHGTTTLNLFEKQSTFHIVPSNFPLIEDGIMGLPLLEKCSYKIENDSISLEYAVISDQRKAILETRRNTNLYSIPRRKPTTICYINTGKRIHQISNEITSQPDKVDFIRAIRTAHIEPALRDSIEKILINYIDVFHLESDALPCTNLTEHEISLKTNKPINIKSYRPPECHRMKSNHR